MNQENAVSTTAAPGLELADLHLMLKLLQVVAKRGAIQVDEMATVGNLYSRLDAFVKAHTPAAPNTEETNNG